MKFSVDPWDVEYGSSVELDEPTRSTADVVVDLELPADQWHPIDAPESLADGLSGSCSSTACAGSTRASGSRTTLETSTRRCARRTPPARSAATTSAIVTHAEVGRVLFCAAPNATDIVADHATYHSAHGRVGRSRRSHARGPRADGQHGGRDRRAGITRRDDRPRS